MCPTITDNCLYLLKNSGNAKRTVRLHHFSSIYSDLTIICITHFVADHENTQILPTIHTQEAKICSNQLSLLIRKKYPCHPPSHHIAIPVYHVNLHQLLWKVFNPLLWLLRRWDIDPIPWCGFCSRNIILIIINHNVNHNINLLF